MVQKLKNTFFFFLFVGSLSIGIFIGRIMSVGREGYEANATQTAAAPIKPSQIVLIAGVDDLSSPQTNLQSAWLAFYEQGSPQFVFIPLYPVNNYPSLHNYLVPHLPIQIIPNDFESLKTLEVFVLQNAIWDDVILMDGQALNQIIYLTNSDSQSYPNEADFAATLKNPWEDPQTALHQQANIYQFLCDHTAPFAQWNNIEKLFGLLGQNIISSLEQREIMVQWQWLSNQSFSIDCRFPPLP